MPWFRAHARIVAATALVSLLALGGLSPAAHGGECHDEECALTLVPHDPASHSIRNGAAGPSGNPLHCVLCHGTRSTRPSAESAHHLPRPVADDVLPHSEVPGVPSRAQAAQPPLRSPPLV